MEHLFCCIRESLDKNNNPSTIEFTTGLEKIVLGASHHSQYQYPIGQSGGAAEPVFLNVYGAPESIPRNEFRQPM